jgi:6-phosphogluconolactonase (cycloisomerase 2 family)
MRHVRLSPAKAARRGVRGAWLTALIVVAVLALLPVGAGAVDAAGGKLYWTNEGGSVRVVNLDGTGGAASLFANEGAPCGLALDPAAGKIYWANFTSNDVRVANLDGSGTASTLFTDSGSLCGVAIDRAAGKIYWANYTANLIRVANLDGTGLPATLFAEPAGSGPSGLAIDRAAGKIYWTNQESDEVRVGNLDGSGTASTLFGPDDAGDNPIGVAIDSAAGKLYWAALKSRQIRVGNLDGAGATSALFVGEESPAGVALDTTDGKIYWGSFWVGRVRAGNLDGSGTATALSQVEDKPLLPAVLRAPAAGDQLPAISGGASLGDPLSCSTGSWKADLGGASLYRAPRSFTYQWQLEGNDIPGATSSSFTFTEAGDYTCRVTAANEAGSSSQTSAAFTVTLLDVVAFYDRNTNGQLDPGENMLPGWRVQFGSTSYSTPKSLKVNPGVYTVSQASPTQSNWLRTNGPSLQVAAAAGERTTARFGDVCIGGGGAEGTGFWTNKNGEALVGADDLAALVNLNLRKADGTNFDPTTYKALSDWLKATSTNMATDLSAQLAVVKLNVLNGKVNGSALISAPGASSANAAGFASVDAVMNEANAELGLHGLTPAGSPFRAYQTVLRDILTKAGTNKTFVQSAPCAFSF